MKRIFVTLFVIMMCYTSLEACDFCGCLAGINPYYNSSNKIILTTLFQHSYIDALSYTEYRRTVELGYQYHPSGEFMITALAPYAFYGVRESGSINGLANGSVRPE